MNYTLYEELQKFPDSPTIGDIPEDLQHRISIFLNWGGRKVDFYDIALDGEYIGFIQDWHDFRHPLGDVLTEMHNPEEFKKRFNKTYMLLMPKKLAKEARQISEENIPLYLNDEYDWGDGDWDAWYPTFSTLQNMIEAHLKHRIL